MPSGLQNWSQTAATNASADSAINWAEGQPPSSVNDSARAMMAVLAKHRDDTAGTLTTAGTSTAYTLATNTVFTTLALLSGQKLSVKFNATNGASPTLNVDGLGAKNIQLVSGTAVPAAFLLANSIWDVTYDNAIPAFIVHNVASALPLTSLGITSATALTAPAIDDEFPIYDLSTTTNKKITLSDTLKVINLLTADATPDRAADYVVTYDASASGPKKVLLQNLPSTLPRGYIDGCTLANGTDATNDINVAAGVCRDSTNAVDITVAAMSGKQLDANWAPGAAAGMRNSAAGITNTTYHIYAVSKADGTQDIYAHTSTTVATVITALQAESGGADYLYARLIGSIVRASNAILAFRQIDDVFIWVTPPLDVNNSSPGTNVAVTGTLTVPTGIEMEVKVNVHYDGQGLYVSALASTDQAATATTAASPLASVGSNSTATKGQNTVYVNTSAQFRYRATGDVPVYMATISFRHPRGRNS
jgi:hypothetical protein